MEPRRGTDAVWSGLKGGAPGQLGLLQLLDAGEVPVDEAGVGERPEVLGGLEFGGIGWQEVQVDVLEYEKHAVG